MQIREAVPEDAAAIARLLTALGYPITAELAKENILRLLAYVDARILVATDSLSKAKAAEDEVEQQVVGFVAIHFIPQLAALGDFCRISYFCVDEQWRNRGVGRALETQVCTLANERHCDRIEVHCHQRRLLAHRFYESQGYTESPKYLLKPL